EVRHRAAGEDVDPKRGVPRPQERGGRADRLRPEARPRAVARGGVERHPDEADVDAGRIAHVRAARERAHARVARRARGVGRTIRRAAAGHSSTTTRSVRSWRSEAPRRAPPCAIEAWMYSSAGPVSRSPGRTLGTPGG